jgi:hypothetical protein
MTVFLLNQLASIRSFWLMFGLALLFELPHRRNGIRCAVRLTVGTTARPSRTVHTVANDESTFRSAKQHVVEIVFPTC